MTDLLRRAHVDVRVAGECLEAFAAGDARSDSEARQRRATVGARLVAEAIHDLRVLARGNG